MSAKVPKLYRLIAASGWFVAFFLFIVICSPYFKRTLGRSLEIKLAQWESTIRLRTQQIAANTWKDQRTLYVFAGDSHIELANWYDLYHGRYAIRNCGLSSATIEDVSRLLDSVPDQEVKCLVLLCGINDLLRKHSIKGTLENYESILDRAIKSRRYQSIFVLALLPINASWPKSDSKKINKTVLEFNQALSGICQSRNLKFIDTSSAVMGADHELSKDLTNDGLHLNGEGYRRLATIIEDSIHRSL